MLCCLSFSFFPVCSLKKYEATFKFRHLQIVCCFLDIFPQWTDTQSRRLWTVHESGGGGPEARWILWSFCCHWRTGRYALVVCHLFLSRHWKIMWFIITITHHHHLHHHCLTVHLLKSSLMSCELLDVNLLFLLPSKWVVPFYDNSLITTHYNFYNSRIVWFRV